MRNGKIPSPWNSCSVPTRVSSTAGSPTTAWLQELPKPLTKLTWDNAAYLSPATANRLGLNTAVGLRGGNVDADVIEVRLNRRTVRAPVWIVPGQAEDTIELQLGYGRSRVGPVGTRRGLRCLPLAHRRRAVVGARRRDRQNRRALALASTQIHHAIEGRDIVRAATLDGICRQAQLCPGRVGTRPRFIQHYEYTGYKWGLSIDLNACIGCNACVVACQSENNIPVVGKDQVLRSREMHWLRIDTYFKGEPDDPETYVQPVPCMHCENAPCEVVCPVAATAHSAEGLNDMVYNRCVGTRYCSNNCPYKVRRFNFLQFSDWNTESLKAQRNPDVTVRSRGVMEKCTYCVQRINQAKIEAEKEGRRVKRRRDRHRLPASLSRRGHRLRRSQRSEEQSRGAKSRSAQLQLARRTQHPAADNLSGRAAQSESATKKGQLQRVSF